MKNKVPVYAAAFAFLCVSALTPAKSANAATINGGIAIEGFSKALNEYYEKITKSEDAISELFSTAEIPSNIAFARVDTNLYIRKGPGINYARIGSLSNNAHVLVESVENGWAKVKSGKISGYCTTQYLVMGEEAQKLAESLGTLTATVKSGYYNVNVRSGADTTAKNVIAQVNSGESFKVLKEVVLNKKDPQAKSFVQIQWNNDASSNNVAYVSSEFVSINYKYKEAIESSNYGDNVSQLRTNMLDYAMKFLGTPYVWGGNSLTKGVDCSGFVKQIFTYAGYGQNMPRVSRDQASKYKKISASEAKAGDLVFYHNLSTGVVDHVAIYIGNGKIIHACNGVEISNVNYRTIYKYARVIWD